VVTKRIVIVPRSGCVEHAYRAADRRIQRTVAKVQRLETGGRAVMFIRGTRDTRVPARRDLGRRLVQWVSLSSLAATLPFRLAAFAGHPFANAISQRKPNDQGDYDFHIGQIAIVVIGIMLAMARWFLAR
jgi:hypothetical protein